MKKVKGKKEKKIDSLVVFYTIGQTNVKMFKRKYKIQWKECKTTVLSLSGSFNCTILLLMKCFFKVL